MIMKNKSQSNQSGTRFTKKNLLAFLDHMIEVELREQQAPCLDIRVNEPLWKLQQGQIMAFREIKQRIIQNSSTNDLLNPNNKEYSPHYPNTDKKN